MTSPFFPAVAAVFGMTLFTPRFGTLDRIPVKSARPLGRRRRSLAFIAVIAGLLTFFLPLVTTNPAVMGHTYWCPWKIAWKIYEGSLPRSIPFMTTAAFLPLVFAFGALCLNSSRDVLAKIAIVGLFTCLASLDDKSSFEALFYGKLTYQNHSLVRHVGFGDLTFLLFGATACLLYIAFNEALDTEAAPKIAIPRTSFGTRDPKFVHAVIRPPSEKD
ncbi:MAG TPA: hypothetical protein VKR59_18085 [Terriglobales bacterium]|nr:hypothetical protein [Terriglobales bacterium]